MIALIKSYRSFDATKKGGSSRVGRMLPLRLADKEL